MISRNLHWPLICPGGGALTPVVTGPWRTTSTPSPFKKNIIEIRKHWAFLVLSTINAFGDLCRRHFSLRKFAFINRGGWRVELDSFGTLQSATHFGFCSSAAETSIESKILRRTSVCWMLALSSTVSLWTLTFVGTNTFTTVQAFWVAMS